MDVVMASGEFQSTEIKLASCVQLCLDVQTVSDIATASGQHSDAALSCGNLEASSSLSNGMGVNQPKPQSSEKGGCGEKHAKLRMNLEDEQRAHSQRSIQN